MTFIPGATGVAFYNSLGTGVQAEAQKLGMTYSTQGAADFSPAAQTPVVDAVCSRHPSLLLIAPTDPVALRPAIQRCMNDGIAVVTVDTSLSDTQGIVSAISSNNIQGGEAAGKIMGQALHGKGEVALMSLSATASTQVQRLQGAKQELKSSYPGISVVATEYTQQAPTSSETTARAILSAHPGIGAFFGAAEPNAEGVAQATASSSKHVINVGYDASPTEVGLLKSGKISALVIQQPALEGQLGVQYGDDYLTGHRSSIKASVLLPNVVVTTQQAGSASVSKYYYTGTS
ncbi:MAG: substrate-binding domain-containing protein [Solirubrobacterales bacterium]|nr:substrate-binding domain-containing protein [Solirubrobacterales bacterium]